MPDFSAQLIRHVINHDSIWTEWEWQRTRRDNSKLFMRGVMIIRVQEGKITWSRLYVEPVEMNGKGIEAAVAEVMQGKKE
jgi:ketosteroid isomerase-like protein